MLKQLRVTFDISSGDEVLHGSAPSLHRMGCQRTGPKNVAGDCSTMAENGEAVTDSEST
jgi:hypothetical protein